MIPHARRIFTLAAALATAGCAIDFGGPAPAPPPSGLSRAEQTRVADLNACRERADQVFRRQNRDQVYRVDTYTSDTRDAPFGTSGLKGVTSAGLPQQFNRDTMVENCMRGSGAAAPPMSRDLQTTGPIAP
jgi:hypothetical protein